MSPPTGRGSILFPNDLWRAPKIAGGWGEPEVLPEPVNSTRDEFYPSLTTDGDLYFTSDRPGGLGGEDIWWVSATVIHDLRAEVLETN